MNGYGKEAFLYYLKNEVDIRDFKVRAIPQINSATKLDHKIRSTDTITRWWIDVLMEGGFSYVSETEFLVGRTTKKREFLAWSEDGLLRIYTDVCYQSYCESVRGHHVEAKNSVSKKIGELLGKKLESDRPGKPEDRKRRYVLPSLQDARKAMDAVLKQPGPWHGEGLEVDDE